MDKQVQTSIEVGDSKYVVDSIQKELRDLEIDEEKESRLVEILRPVLLSPMEELIAESWYVDKKDTWLPDFDTVYAVHLCSELLFQQYLEQGDSISAAKVKLNTGWMDFVDTDYAACIESQREVLALTNIPYLVGWAENTMGAAIGQVDEHGGGRAYFQKVLDMPSIESMPGLRSASLMNLAIEYSFEGDLERALELLYQAKEVLDGTDYYSIKWSVDYNLSAVLMDMGKTEEGIALLVTLPGFAKGVISRDNVFANITLGDAYIDTGDYEQAEKYIERGCELAEVLDLDFGKMMCWDSRTVLYERLGQYEKALQASRAFFTLEDDQEGARTSRKLASLSAQLDIQEKDAEIERANRRLLESEARSHSQQRQIMSYSIFLFAALALAFLLTYFKNKALATAQQRSRAEAKLQLLQTQMSPHFLFNALSGIQNYILKSEKAVAYSYLGQFGSMLRNLAESTDQVEAELNEEVEFIKNYLELEKLRFREEFNYSIVVNEELSKEQHYIPSMVIQPIVENAMIHGLAGLERKGLLLVNISPYRDGIRCKVTDNGRGRVAAAEISKQTGQKKKHLSISSLNTQSRLECLRKIGYENAHLNIADLYEDGRASGTEVTIYLPFMNMEN